MNPDAVKLLADGIFSKAIQVHRMLERDAPDFMRVPMAEIVVLADKLRPMLAPEDITEAAARLAGQRWHVPVVDLDCSEGYAAWAEGYDTEANALIAVEEPTVLELIGDVAGKDVLDGACGTGRYALRLAQAGGHVVGLDASEEMLAVARRKQAELGTKVEFLLAEVERLPCADASFDLAICALATCHLPDLDKALKELGRVLRPGGRLIISDFHPYCLLVGWRTGYRRASATYHIENHLHHLQDYFAALEDNGMHLTTLREELVDERLSPMLGEDVERFRGWPIALILQATKGDGR